MVRTKKLRRHAALLPKQKTELKLKNFEKIKRIHPTQELANLNQIPLVFFEWVQAHKFMI